MNIEVKNDTRNLVSLKDLKCGEVFVYKGDYCLALDNHSFAYYNISKNFMEIDPNGEYTQEETAFNEDEEVEVLDATLVITRK